MENRYEKEMVSDTAAKLYTGTRALLVRYLHWVCSNEFNGTDYHGR